MRLKIDLNQITWKILKLCFAKSASTSSPAQAKAMVHCAGWGSKGGNEEDKRDLRDIIATELKRPENRGDFEHASLFHICFRFGWGPCWGYQWRILQFVQDLEGRQFSWLYWSEGRFPCIEDWRIISQIQIRHWVRSMESHLGVRATPVTIVGVIRSRRLNQANRLKDSINAEFGLEN